MIALQTSPQAPGGINSVAIKATRRDIPTARAVVAYMDAQEDEWAKRYDRKAWALAHSQVTASLYPLRFFVVHPELVAAHENPINARFPSRTIFNPVVLEAPKEVTKTKPVRRTVMNPQTGLREIKDVIDEYKISNVHTCKEGCMSFPQRKAKNIERVYRVKVRYWYPVTVLGFEFLRPKTEWVEGLKAQIFQHECEHMDAKNIYYD